MFGDGTEIWVLEKAGIGRADLVVAVTGDDEDNIIISQVAKLKFGVPKVVARVNNPFNQPTFDLLGIDATICAATNMLRLIMHELPGAQVRAPALAQAREHRAGRARGGRDLAARQHGHRDIELPEGVLRRGHPARRQRAGRAGSTEILPGDYVICLLQPGQENELIKAFLPEEVPEEVQRKSELDTSEG